MVRSIGFIGGGRVTRILLGGWKLGHALPEVVRVSDPGADSLEKLRRLLPGVERFAGDNVPPASCDIALTGAILAEILQGIFSDSEFARLRKALSSFLMLQPASGETYAQAAKLCRAGRKRGVTIRSLVDCIIAAIAMEHGAVILHKDRHYERLSEYAPLKAIPGIP